MTLRIFHQAQGANPLRMEFLLLAPGVRNPSYNSRPLGVPLPRGLGPRLGVFSALVAGEAEGVLSGHSSIKIETTRADEDALGMHQTDPVLLRSARLVGEVVKALAGSGLLDQSRAGFATADVVLRMGNDDRRPGDNGGNLCVGSIGT
ncbi:hypothetical protein QBC32DRAFT_365902 [Pseudoneurospora amorphoporcata]|uniref:Uncharacterized protein n=1 Tax=Pseudoneurospora amorphoporcata TaxID=241081 RepID=A0AAN6NK14_9PEZI|nr:hypothetical protein QBC32DRAFT_365902 [Pseudoneurospora amorphoporcata]